MPSRVFAARSASPRRRSSSTAEAGGNFGARPKPPHSGSASSASRRVGLVEQRLGQRLGGRIGRGGLLERIDQQPRPLGHLLAPIAVEVGDGHEQLREGRHPMPRLGWEVGAPEERLALGGEEGSERPAALAGQGHDRVHVDGVHVRPLLAIDLDVDEALVHERRRVRILEGLVRHHVAPVAGRIADREEDRLVLLPRARERLLAPRVPVDGVVGVLQEIRARLVCQAIHARLG